MRLHLTISKVLFFTLMGRLKGVQFLAYGASCRTLPRARLIVLEKPYQLHINRGIHTIFLLGANQFMS